MKILVKSAKVIDNESPFNNKVVDILIEDGVIKEIASPVKAKKVDREISFENLHVSQGWFDSSVSFGEASDAALPLPALASVRFAQGPPAAAGSPGPPAGPTRARPPR